MRVWRLEHPGNGEGPYSSDDDEVDNMMESHRDWDDTIHPAPHEEGLRYDAGVHWSGCESLAALRAWFEAEFDILVERYGFHAVTYEVPDEYVQTGEKQLCFEMEFATDRAVHIS